MFSFSSVVLATQPEDDDEDAPIVTSPRHQSNSDEEDSAPNTAPPAAASSEEVAPLPINFDLKDVKPTELEISPEAARQIGSLKLDNFTTLPSNVQNFIIQRTETEEDRQYFENLKNRLNSYGPQEAPATQSSGVRELAQQGREFWGKLRVRKCGGLRDPLSGQKVKGSSGWCVQYRLKF